MLHVDATVICPGYHCCKSPINDTDDRYRTYNKPTPDIVLVTSKNIRLIN